MERRSSGAGARGGVPPAGPLPVVFLHGLRTSRSMWRAQVAAVEASGHAAAAIDLPGHGRRQGEDLTLDGAVDAVRVAVDAVGGRALVVGLSLGGYVAIVHAARFPAQVAGLVAASCCTRPHPLLVDGWAVAARAIGRLPDHGAALNALAVRLALPPAGAADVAAGGFALDVMGPALRALRGVDVLAALRSVEAPVWLVNGRFDHFRGEERAFLAACREGRLVVVPGATHLVSLVRPTRFSRAVLEALAAVEDRAAQAPSDQARTPPTMPASLGTTTTSSPSRSSTAGVMRRAFPPPR